MNSESEAQGTPRQRAYLLCLLLGVTFFYQLDRNVMYITQELIKNEFQLSDTEIGLLTGIAYGLANGLAGLPIGWLIDRVSRKKLLGAIVGCWSGMTALCGFAGSFGHLFLARVGVGLAEAGGTPTTLSIVSDVYPPERRASKVSIVFAGYGAGTVVSFLAGGYLAEAYGWRAVFLIYGLPGVFLSILILTTLKEPKRRRQGDEAPIAASQIPKAVLRLLRTPGLGILYLAVSLTTMISAGVFAWWSSFMIRVHGLDLFTVGLIGTFGPGLFGLVAMLVVGFAADRARRSSPGGPLFLISVISVVNLFACLAAIWTPSLLVMIVALCIASATVGLYIVPGNAAVSELAPSHLRGLAFSMNVVITNIIGAAFGPMLIGMISDFAAANMPGIEPLRVAMTTVVLLQLPVAMIYLLAGRGRNARERPMDRAHG